MQVTPGQLVAEPGDQAPIHLEGAVVGLAAEGGTGLARLDGELNRLSDGALLRGEVAAPFRLECARCTKSFTWVVRAPVDVLMTSAGGSRDTDADVIPWSGWGSVDLDGALRGALLSVLPMKPLCRPDCAGLCQSCGADLNDGPCGCSPSIDEDC